LEVLTLLWRESSSQRREKMDTPTKILVGILTIAILFTCCVGGTFGFMYARNHGWFEIALGITQPIASETTEVEVVEATSTPTTEVAPVVAEPVVSAEPTFTPTTSPVGDPVATCEKLEEIYNNLPNRTLPTGEPLVFRWYPYPLTEGQPETSPVVCEVEILDFTSDTEIPVASGGGMLVADFNYGHLLDNGAIESNCPRGADCEGVWVANRSFSDPAGTTVHLYVYKAFAPALDRFQSYGTPNFACEYAAATLTFAGETIFHDETNIRVPLWALGSGTIGNFATGQHCPLP